MFNTAAKVGKQWLRPRYYSMTALQPRPRSKTFRSILAIDKIKPEKLTELVYKSRADAIILHDDDPDLHQLLGQNVNVPVFIRSETPTNISDHLHQYRNKIYGLVATMKDGQRNNEYNIQLTELEKSMRLSKQHFALIPVFDSRYSYKDWADIASSSDRNIAAILEDNAPENSDILPKPPSRIEVQCEALLAARAANIFIVLGPDMNKSHYSFYRWRNERAKQNGFDGRVALNEDQSIICHDVFSVSYEEKVMMDAVLSNSAKGISTWQRSATESRQMIGPPHRAKAYNLKDKLENEQQVDRVSTSGRLVTAHPETIFDIQLGERLEVYLNRTQDVLEQVWRQMCPVDAPLHMSDLEAQRLGFQKRPLPFSLLLSQAIAASQMQFTGRLSRFHLGIHDAVQCRPAYAHDELKIVFQPYHIRHSKQGYPIVKSLHYLLNEQDEVVLTAKKTTMLSKEADLQDGELPENMIECNPLLDQIMDSDYSGLRIHQKKLHPGQIIVHERLKCFNKTVSRGLSNVLTTTNQHHLNHRRYLEEDVVVMGPGALMAATYISAPDLGHVVYETWPNAYNVNITNPTDVIRAISYVRQVTDVTGNPDLEEVELKMFVIKNADLETMISLQLPTVLLEDDNIKPVTIEMELRETCPEINYKVVAVFVRSIIRLKCKE